MERFKLTEIIEAADGVLLNKKASAINKRYIDKIVIDSRIDEKYKHNQVLFIPLIGEKQDGHKYIENAVKLGAKVCLVSKQLKDLDYISDEVIYIKVKDTKQALIDLAIFYRNKFEIKVVAITGSVGKTTTKDVVASVLSEKYRVHKTEGNYNSETGVPLTIFELNKEHEIAVVELGTDHFGEMAASSKIARPSTICFTNIGISHLETFKTRENIFKEKLDILNHSKLNATVILNADNDILQSFIKKKNDAKYKELKLKWYGKENKELSELLATNINIDFNKLSVKFDINLNGETYALEIPGVSEHLVYAALIATLVGLEHGMDIIQIRKGLLNYKPTKMRMNILKQREDFYIIDDVYNASPDSMNSLIDVIEKITDKKKMVILGDMFELGDMSEVSHKNIGIRLASDNIDICILVGKNMKAAYDSLKNKKPKNKKILYFETRLKLEKYLTSFWNKNKIKKMLKNVVIGIKASRGMALEKIVEIICNK